MKRVMITGVAGHLGSRLAAWVLREHPGTEVVGVDDMSCGYEESVPAGVELRRCRVSELPPDDFSRPLDAVFHLAAYAAECLSPFARRYNYDNNLGETAALLNRLLEDPHRHGRLVFASSAAVYGPGSCPLDENSPCTPHDPYGVAKLACEMDIRVAGHQHGLDWCVLRPHNVYGPGQSLWQRYRGVVALWMRSVLEDRPIVVFGDGTQQRALTYVDEVLPCVWAAAFRPGASRAVINVGGAEPVTVNALVELVRAACEKPDHPVDRQPARHEVKRVWCTVARSRAILKYREYVGLASGLAAQWAWSREAWERFPARRAQEHAPPLELRRGLPPAWRGAR